MLYWFGRKRKILHNILAVLEYQQVLKLLFWDGRSTMWRMILPTPCFNLLWKDFNKFCHHDFKIYLLQVHGFFFFFFFPLTSIVCVCSTGGQPLEIRNWETCICANTQWKPVMYNENPKGSQVNLSLMFCLIKPFLVISWEIPVLCSVKLKESSDNCFLPKGQTGKIRTSSQGTTQNLRC